MPALIIKWAWDNKQLIAEILGAIALAILCWWFFVHNPKVIKQLETEKTALKQQITARDNAINMLGNIERAHDVITKISYKYIETIRNSPAPASDGLFYDSGSVLHTVFSGNSSARGAVP